MPITPLPTPPSRQDAEATFVSRANAFLGALPLFVTEANAQAVDVNTAREVAVAAANYRGDYAAGTTYQVGQSVTYLGNFFYAKTINTGVTPVQGTNWQQYTPMLTSYQEFTASGTWTAPVNATWVYVEAIGGGGGGGRGTSIGAGGGGGGFNASLFRASDVGNSVTVTIGAGGAGIASLGGSNPGSDGGNTTFGALVTAYGGKGGTPSGEGGYGGGGQRNSGGYSSGAGGSEDSSAFQRRVGYDCIKGGAGGGSGGAALFNNGGVSASGGNGGRGAPTGSTASDRNGIAPGGGGGGKRYVLDSEGASGNGAAGRVRVWAW